MTLKNHKVFVGILCLYFILAILTYALGRLSKTNLADASPITGRRTLQISNCTPRSVEEFPNDFMTRAEREHGGVIFHIVVSIYLFMSLAIICDDYFVSALERICEVFKLKHDVAGATFMAAGNSAPELFTSIIGVFITNSDVGVSTIVGSAVFNILCVVAVSGIFAGMVIHLTWWPLIRDCFIYCVSVILLIIVIYDGSVHWYEAVILLVWYIFYIVMLYFNEELQKFFESRLTGRKDLKKPEYEILLPRKISSHLSLLGQSDEEESMIATKSLEISYSKLKLAKSLSNLVEEPSSIFDVPESFIRRLYWVTMMPIKVVCFLTIPDCRKPGILGKLFILTFLMSIAWIGIITYIIVWMVCITGDTLGIPDTIMGVTLLAAGISVPDAVSSALVAREGYGDMAISNGIGSNIIDILVCLGFPWLIKTGLLVPGSVIQISSTGLTYTIGTLLATVVILVVTIMINKWRLTRLLGFIFLLIYIIVLIFSCLYELSVFGNLSLLPCPRTRP